MTSKCTWLVISRTESVRKESLGRGEPTLERLLDHDGDISNERIESMMCKQTKITLCKSNLELVAV